MTNRILSLRVEELPAELLLEDGDEQELQQEGEEEVGHGEAEVREAGGEVVERRVLTDRAHHPDQHRQRGRQQYRAADQEECVPGGVADDRGDRTLSAKRRAPVALHEVLEPQPVLLGPRAVEVVLVLEVTDGLLRGARSVTKLCQRVAARRHQHEHDDRREHDDWNGYEKSSPDVRDHRARFYYPV